LTAIEFRGVTVRYESRGGGVLEGVTLAVETGEKVALTGRNGSGKTTLLKAAVGLVPHEGEIRVVGERLEGRTLAAVRGRVGFLFNVPEDQLLFPTVEEDVAFGLLRRGWSPPEAIRRAREVLHDLGVEDLANAPVHHLSHGEKQRVALAGVLVTSPDLLLLDEPSASLDPPGRRALALLLRGLPTPMLVATHDLDFAARVCTRFLVLDRGRIQVDTGDVEEVARWWSERMPRDHRDAI